MFYIGDTLGTLFDFGSKFFQIQCVCVLDSFFRGVWKLKTLSFAKWSVWVKEINTVCTTYLHKVSSI